MEYDPIIYKKAKRSVGFKSHFTIYILVNILFWLLWIFISYGDTDKFPLPWPVLPTVGWGVAIVFHYLYAFKWSSNLIDKEYEKLIKKEINLNK
ncbi:MAG: 2TM domain-containing protein [Bacteroidota bacterium]|jgi:hypothetical protein